MTPPDDPAEAFRKAELHLRDVLFGDGFSRVGFVKGEESRAQVGRLLRRMRDAFEAASLREEERADKAEARASDLEDELRGIVKELRRIAASETADRSHASQRKAS